MWKHRELVTALTVADLKNRYQNTSLGFFWSILSPFAYAFVLYIVFRGLFAQEKDYVSNLVVGIMAWRFFTTGSMQALNAFIVRGNLVTKVALPRHLIVFSNVLSTLISSTLEFVILIPIIYVLRGSVPVTFPLFLVIHIIFFMLIYGLGLFLASVYIYFRDMNNIWEVLLNMLMFCSPIFYPISIVGGRILPYYLANPITQIIILYRQVMVAGQLPGLNHLLIAIGFAIGALLVGALTFSKLQRRFAEEL